jgi:hypothetical protein
MKISLLNVKPLMLLPQILKVLPQTLKKAMLPHLLKNTEQRGKVVKDADKEAAVKEEEIKVKNFE